MADLDRTELPSGLLGPTLAASGDGARRDGEAPLERGAVVGRYVIVDRLGAGGMGIVYSAYDPELDRKVALKLLRAGDGAGRDARDRLLREAQALARLDHPNVVSVHDVGSVGARVWLAMEFVDGRTLGRWSVERPRSWREVVEVMTQAGRGLAAAHAVGLVHRDFKPDNVMVSHDGRVRVMDLGLARLGGEGPAAPAAALAVQTQSRLALELTQAGAVLGTPVYMSPEQFRGEEVGVATDVFAYCVTFWEALFGERPFAGETLAELVMHVSDGKLRAPPRGRRAPGWLRRIVERGLAVDPSRRWPDMPALLAALARAQARGRSRLAVAALTLVAAVAAGAWGWTRAAEARRIAACEEVGASLDAAWNDATRRSIRDALVATGSQLAASTADRVLPLLDDYAAAWQRASVAVCLDRDPRWTGDDRLLDRAWWCIDERRTEFESLLERLSQADREAVQEAVPAARELERVESCRDIAVLSRQPPLPGGDRAELRAIRRDLARSRNADLTGQFSAGFALAARAHARARELGWASAAAAATLRRSNLLNRLGRPAEATAAAEDAYFAALDAGALGVAADAATRLVFLTGYELAQHAEGKRWWRHAIASIRALEPRPSLRTAHAFVSLANIQYVTGEYAEARANFERALAIEQEELGPLHTRTAATLGNLAAIPFATGDYAAARALYERALAVEEEVLGPEHPEYARTLNNLATVAYITEDMTAARALFERALAIRERALGPEHPDLAFSVTGLADVLEDTGDHAGARALFERALAIREKALGPEHPDVAVNLLSLGNLRFAEGDLEAARRLYERALAVSERAFGSDHPDVASARTALALVYEAMGADADARRLLEGALADLDRALGPAHPTLINTLVQLADLSLKERRSGEADELAARAAAIAEATSTSGKDLARARFIRARAQWDMAPADRVRALELARQARDGLRVEGDDTGAIDRWLAERSSP